MTAADVRRRMDDFEPRPAGRADVSGFAWPAPGPAPAARRDTVDAAMMLDDGWPDQPRRRVAQAAGLGWDDADLITRVGPKGYIHNWIFVGIPHAGDQVFHPVHGHGTVHAAVPGRVDVHFHGSGATHSFPVQHDPGPNRFEQMTDEQVVSHLGDGTGEGFKHALAELDRRDKAERQAKIDALYARPASTKGQRDRLYGDLVGAGENPEDAWSHAYGRGTDAMRRQAAIAQLRAQGYAGANFDAITRAAFRDEQQRLAIDAEAATKGVMLSKAGVAAGVDPWSLFGGTEAAARKYASPELLAYWDRVGRRTVAEFQDRLLGAGGRIGGPAGGDFLK